MVVVLSAEAKTCLRFELYGVGDAEVHDALAGRFQLSLRIVNRKGMRIVATTLAWGG